ncbi:hypothetical protein [Sphingobacterium multivorum]|uniref:hypothetical protein n=1 Tax=Sphingobacterium multivorum TaxID=28454 RepID=UPI0031B9AFF3
MRAIVKIDRIVCLVFFLIWNLNNVISQQVSWSQEEVKGLNSDPHQKKIGGYPYEMEGRTEVRQPLVDFEDCSRWKVRTYNTQAALYRTEEQRVIGQHSGKVLYKTSNKSAGFRVELTQPIVFKKEWDCINFWNYGDHWLWENSGPAMTHAAIVKDAKGKEIVIPFMQEWLWRNMNYKYWFLNHIKLNDSIARPITLVGLEFKGDGTQPNQENNIFLGPLYGYQEILKPVKYKTLPEKLPFPVRKETILPTNKTKEFSNTLRKEGNTYIFSYTGKDAMLDYKMVPTSPMAEINLISGDQTKVINAGADLIFEYENKVAWTVLDQTIANNQLQVRYRARSKEGEVKFLCKYEINQKSFIVTIEELAAQGRVAEIRLGRTDKASAGKLVDIPFLSYNPFANDSYTADRPSLLAVDNLFFFTMFDWYYSNASVLYAGQKGIEGGLAAYNGGARYYPLNNKKRNPVRERLFYNVSPDVQEVFPTIDNPASPMRSNQANRLWAINGGSDLVKLADFVTDLRSKGLEHVSIRYHEEFWREGGESFTFRTKPNPTLGVKKIRDFVKFVQQQDWRIGLYTNYMDLAPVNALWNEDWVRISHKDFGWGPAWCRNYAPKPAVGYEQQAILAPQIHKTFGTNFSYCDVATCISPMDRVDYDYRVPGAGKFRSTIDYIGMTLLNERRAYQGPVYSEGGVHFFYAGLLDGNYAWVDRSLPIFPDFQLLKINPLEMDAIANVSGYEYLAYAYAFGSIGMLSEGADAVMRYAFMQPFQEKYIMEPVKDIAYFDNGQFLSSSEAVKKDLIKSPKLKVTYGTKLELYSNFSDSEWTVEVGGRTYCLPKYGVLAYSPNENLFAVSALNKEAKESKRIDKVYSNELYYLNTNGEIVTEPLGGKGCYMVKKEKFGWEVIPVTNLEKVDIDCKLLGFSGTIGLDVEAVDKNGQVIETINTHPFKNTISFNHDNRAFKYRICPVTRFAENN